MTTARQTYEATNANSATPGSAANTRVNSNEQNALTYEETVNNVGAGPNGGTSLATGVTAAQALTIKNAAIAYQVAKDAACRAEQAAIQVAKDTLRATGDYAPA
jgi:hypothetical protein